MTVFKPKYYSLKNIKSKHCQYNVIIGERSNGKSYAVLEEILKNFCATGEQGAIIRRFEDDLKGKRGDTVFNNLVSNGLVTKYTNGEYSDIVRYSGRWFLSRTEEDGTVKRMEKPFCWAFALSGVEHDKSSSYPDITTVFFDEFISRSRYFPDEFIYFMNTLSTIIRDRNNVTIYMCGNTVNKYCPYFSEMGLKHIKDMQKGDIDVYSYGDSDLSVAVEFSDSPSKQGKPSDVYFAFDNPRLKMITGKGQVWEIAIYPHKPCKTTPKEIIFTYFVQFDGDLLQCEIINHENMLFTFVHLKTTPLKAPDKDLIYTLDHDPRPNYKRRLTAPTNQREQRILWFYKNDKVFYQDNETGEIMRNYLQWCLRGE